MKKKLIVIAGPTACGKTEVSVKLAKLADGEIISADSMQIYKYMNIGTAKITPDETRGVPHYMIDELEPDEEFSVAVFQKKASAYAEEIYKKGKLPLLVGGTGFYINAFIYGNDFSIEKEDKTVREELQKMYLKKGGGFLYDMLEKVDKKSAENIHPNNVKKVMRALEFYKQTGKKISEHNTEEKKREPIYDASIYILNTDREQLYRCIDRRVDIMLENGLLKEVKALLDRYDPSLTSMQGLGYKEFVPYFKGSRSLEESVEILKRDTRHFAKRQLTWFRHQCDGTWINTDEFASADDIAGYIYQHWRKNNGY